MKTCGTCKYRGKEVEGQIDEDFNFGPVGYFQCDLINHDSDFKYKKGMHALVVDGSGYHAALCVEDDFGCNRWEPARTSTPFDIDSSME